MNFAQTTELPTLLTQTEVADYLRISHKTLERDRWLGQGLPFLKIGRAVRYRSTDLVAYVSGEGA